MSKRLKSIISEARERSAGEMIVEASSDLPPLDSDQLKNLSSLMAGAIVDWLSFSPIISMPGIDYEGDRGAGVGFDLLLGGAVDFSVDERTGNYNIKIMTGHNTVWEIDVPRTGNLKKDMNDLEKKFNKAINSIEKRYLK